MTEYAIAAPLVIGVTSHRDLVAAEIEPIRGHVRALIAVLRRDFPTVPLVVLSSLAEGGDQLVAEEALDAGVRLVAALPMARAEYARDFSDAAALARFGSLCDAAEIIEVPHRAGVVPADATPAPEGPARDVRYADAGVYVSDHCHLLLAIWDGKPSASLGGTAQIVRYHLSGVRPSEQRPQRAPQRARLRQRTARVPHRRFARSGATARRCRRCARSMHVGAPAMRSRRPTRRCPKRSTRCSPARTRSISIRRSTPPKSRRERQPMHRPTHSSGCSARRTGLRCTSSVASCSRCVCSIRSRR